MQKAIFLNIELVSGFYTVFPVNSELMGIKGNIIPRINHAVQNITKPISLTYCSNNHGGVHPRIPNPTHTVAPRRASTVRTPSNRSTQDSNNHPTLDEKSINIKKHHWFDRLPGLLQASG